MKHQMIVFHSRIWRLAESILRTLPLFLFVPGSHVSSIMRRFISSLTSYYQTISLYPNDQLVVWSKGKGWILDHVSRNVHNSRFASSLFNESCFSFSQRNHNMGLTCLKANNIISKIFHGKLVFLNNITYAKRLTPTENKRFLVVVIDDPSVRS